MCILQPAITNKETLIDALEKSDIEKIRVFEDILDGNRITSYIRCCGDFSRVRHSVIVITKTQKK